ncbi:MAG: hypothetical protein ACXAEU_06780 [Candidatus Hodarchaeales archaeon]|jgi:hypothetical protein
MKQSGEVIEMKKNDLNKIGYEREASSQFGLKYRLKQIIDTVIFEIEASKKKTAVIMIVYSGIVFLNLLMHVLQEKGDSISPVGVISFTSTLVIISSIAYSSSIVVRDFERPTGNIIFPKIPRTRLLTGRLIATVVMVVIVFGSYYLTATVVIQAVNGQVPGELLHSFAYTLLYSVLLLSFVTCLSSYLKSTPTVIIAGLLSLLILCPILEALLMIFQSDIEPLLVLTYYSRPITAVFSGMTGESNFDIVQVEIDGIAMKTWISPTPVGTLAGVIIFSVIFIIISYFRTERR